MLIGYMRVSSLEQNLSFQEDSLKEVFCERIFVDQVSGSTTERKGLQLALEVLRKGDTLVVWRLDRLGRSLKHLIELVSELEKKEVGFRSLTENIDTTKAEGRLIFHLFAAFAEFEKNLIRERTMAGLAAARARGRNGGRPKSLTPEQRQVAVGLYKEKKHSIKEICRIMGISKPTLYSYLREATA